MTKFEVGHLTNVTHGLSASPEYQCWADMKQRCLNPDAKFFEHYGGRGVTICDRWRDSFEDFISDVGHRPTPAHTIDRHPDNDGNYEPGNVRWATRQQQIDNRRNTRKIMIDGETLSLTQACKKFGVDRKLVATRIYEYGWSVERALTPPLWRRK
jgi:hypothetical protein